MRRSVSAARGIDSVWNYGVFDFNEPNFVGRFVSGQTDYMLASYPFPLFMAEYVQGTEELWNRTLTFRRKRPGDYWVCCVKRRFPAIARTVTIT